MKKHWFHIIRYILVILLLWACIVIFGQPFLLLLLFLMLILPLISYWLFRIAASHLTFRSYSLVSSVEKGNPISITIECNNTSYFPLFAVTLLFTLENLYRPNTMQHKLTLPALPRRVNKITIPVETACCGMVSFQISSVEVSDYLHFFTTRLSCKQTVTVPVLPETISVELPSTAPVSDGMEEFTESDLKGNLSSDIKEIREYRPGDRLQRIHWKLSAKLDDLLVKELAHTTILSLVVLPECNRENMEDTIASLYSVMNELWKREERFEVCLYNHAACEFSFFLITSEEEMTECIIHFYYQPLYEGETEAKDAYFASSQKSATILHICGSELKRLDGDVIIG